MSREGSKQGLSDVEPTPRPPPHKMRPAGIRKYVPDRTTILEAYKRVRGGEVTNKEMAEELGLNETELSHCLRMIDLFPEIKAGLGENAPSGAPTLDVENVPPHVESRLEKIEGAIGEIKETLAGLEEQMSTMIDPERASQFYKNVEEAAAKLGIAKPKEGGEKERKVMVRIAENIDLKLSEVHTSIDGKLDKLLDAFLTFAKVTPTKRTKAEREEAVRRAEGRLEKEVGKEGAPAESPKPEGATGFKIAWRKPSTPSESGCQHSCLVAEGRGRYRYRCLYCGRLVQPPGKAKSVRY